jgi:hypothetical protein
MYELFKGNADICIRMAASTTHREVRDRWIELAATWRSKAEAYKQQSQVSESIKHVEVSPPTSPGAVALPEPQARPANIVANAAPTPELRVVASEPPPLVPHDEQEALDAIWQALQPPARQSRAVK